MWRCGDNVRTIISTYLIFMQLQSQSRQILNLESYSFCPLIFFDLELRLPNISKKKKWLWKKHFLWPINDKCVFLRKWSHFFLAFLCLFSVPGIFLTLLHSDHPGKHWAFSLPQFGCVVFWCCCCCDVFSVRGNLQAH